MNMLPEVQALLQKCTHVFRLLVHGRLWSDDPTIVFMNSSIFDDLQHSLLRDTSGQTRCHGASHLEQVAHLPNTADITHASKDAIRYAFHECELSIGAQMRSL